MTHTRAFTLIEASTVMVVIGVMAAVAGVGLSDQLKQAQSSADVASKAEEFQAHYHRAREQMRGLRFEPDATNGTVRVAQVESCQSAAAQSDSPCVNVAGEVGDGCEGLEHGTIRLVPSVGFCLEPNGEVQPLVQLAPAVAQAIGEEQPAAVSTSAVATPLVLLETPTDEGKRIVGLRLDRTGFTEAFRLNERGGTTAFNPSHPNFDGYLLELGGPVQDIRAPTQTPPGVPFGGGNEPPMTGAFTQGPSTGGGGSTGDSGDSTGGVSTGGSSTGGTSTGGSSTGGSSSTGSGGSGSGGSGGSGDSGDSTGDDDTGGGDDTSTGDLPDQPAPLPVCTTNCDPDD